MRFQGSKIGRMASWDVVGGAGVENPGGHGESVYTIDSKPAIETATLRPGRKLMTSVRALFPFITL